jgi:hypothetical protein
MPLFGLYFWALAAVFTQIVGVMKKLALATAAMLALHRWLRAIRRQG